MNTSERRVVRGAGIGLVVLFCLLAWFGHRPSPPVVEQTRITFVPLPQPRPVEVKDDAPIVPTLVPTVSIKPVTPVVAPAPVLLPKVKLEAKRKEVKQPRRHRRTFSRRIKPPKTETEDSWLWPLGLTGK